MQTGRRGSLTVRAATQRVFERSKRPTTARENTMPSAFEKIYDSIGSWAETHGIRVRDESLSPGKAGEFNGVTATMNRGYDVQERAYYLVHALGSIVRW